MQGGFPLVPRITLGVVDVRDPAQKIPGVTFRPVGEAVAGIANDLARRGLVR